MNHTHVYTHFLERLAIIFGEPKTTDIKLFYAEYADALKGCSEAALKAGVEQLRRTHRYPGWPTVAKCLEAIEDAMPRPVFQSPNFVDPPPPTEKGARARVAAIAAEFSRNAHRVPVIGISKRAALIEQGQHKTDAERQAELNAFIRDGEARMYERDRAAIRARMAASAMPLREAAE